jgi:glycerophosphoryl diester phosphodiesterase
MIAFENALASGVEHIETDVHVSADGIVHCFHDDTTNRVTGVPGRFSEMTSGEIARLAQGEIPPDKDARALARYFVTLIQGLRVLMRARANASMLRDVVGTALEALA